MPTTIESTESEPEQTASRATQVTEAGIRRADVVKAFPGASLEIAGQSFATQGEAIEIRATLRTQGPALRRIAEFHLDGNKKDQQVVELPANGEAEVKFRTPKLDPSVTLHQGLVRVSGAPDPLKFDDERYFTFTVRPALKVVIVSDLPIDAEFVRAYDKGNAKALATAAGTGLTSDIANCINWTRQQGVKVISMSLGGGDNATLKSAVQTAYNNGNGVLLVAAAGNDGDDKNQKTTKNEKKTTNYQYHSCL